MKPKIARPRRSLFVIVSQGGRGGANELSSSLFLPFPLPFPSFAFLCHSLFFSYKRARLRFYLSFLLERRRCTNHPALRPFQIETIAFLLFSRCPSISSRLAQFPFACRFSSCSMILFTRLPPSTCNYCQYFLLFLCAFIFSYLLPFYFISMSFQ